MGSIAQEFVAPEIVELSGNPRDVYSAMHIEKLHIDHHRQIGLQHGRQLSSKIHAQIQVYTAMFKSTSKLDWPAVRLIAQEYSQTIENIAPELYEEMKGIAEGAGVGVLDVVALNARSEIALGLFEDGCTSVGWKTGGEGVYLAQSKPSSDVEMRYLFWAWNLGLLTLRNIKGEYVLTLSTDWDWTARVKQNLAMMSIEQPGKPKIWMITEVRSPLNYSPDNRH